MIIDCDVHNDWSSADPDEIASAVTRLFQRYDVRIFAPSHGNLIRADARRYVGHLLEGMRQASAMSVRL